ESAPLCGPRRNGRGRSDMALALRLFSICPRIRKEGGKLIAMTGWRVRVLARGLFYRQVIVDPKKEVVILRRRYGWFFARGWRIPFRSVQAIGYGYRDLVGDWWFWAHDAVDLFTVRLRLQSGTERHLFH